MDARRVVALSDVVVALTTIGPGKVNAWIAPEVGTVEDGGGGFWSVHIQCTLRIC